MEPGTLGRILLYFVLAEGGLVFLLTVAYLAVSTWNGRNVAGRLAEVESLLAEVDARTLREMKQRSARERKRDIIDDREEKLAELRERAGATSPASEQTREEDIEARKAAVWSRYRKLGGNGA